MEVADCIFFQLGRASRAGAEFWAKRVEHLGVTAVQALALNFLGQEDRVPSHVLGQKMGVTSATLTGILDRLAKLELVERLPHPEDRRAVLVCLTEKGAGHAREINRLMLEANKDFLASLGQGGEKEFRRLLARVWQG